MSLHELFQSNEIGTIDLPVKKLVRHPRQRRFRVNHAALLRESMHQTARRALAPISVVLPASMDGLDEDSSRWVNSASQGTLEADIPDKLRLYVIDGWHRTYAAQQHVDSYANPDEIPSAALVWPAKVYKSRE
jgi:hypothetical protein